jgi:hypothetical protein
MVGAENVCPVRIYQLCTTHPYGYSAEGKIQLGPQFIQIVSPWLPGFSLKENKKKGEK